MSTRSVTSQIPSADVELQSVTGPWLGLLSLWRYGVWLVLMFALLTTALWVRLQVGQSVQDLERNATLMREATLHQERLQLEIQTRRRAVLLETYATQLELTDQAPMVTP